MPKAEVIKALGYDPGRGDAQPVAVRMISGMPESPDKGLIFYEFDRWMDCRPDYPYFLIDYPLWGKWRVTWWLSLN